MSVEQAREELAQIDAELAAALETKEAAWLTYQEAKEAAKRISQRRDPIAERCWALEKAERDAEEAEFREAFRQHKLSGNGPLSSAGKFNGGTDNG